MTRDEGSARKKADELSTRAARLRAEAERLEQESRRWESGEAGEARVAAVLDRMAPDDGLAVLHDRLIRPGSRANLDHVVVGPFGVLIVDAKNWNGPVSAAGGLLRRDGHRQDKTLAFASDAAALARKAVPDLPARAVVCLAGNGSVGRPAEVGGVAVVDLADLPGWIRSLPQVVEPDQVISASARVEALFPAQPQRPAARARTDPRRHGAPGSRPRRSGGVRTVLAGLAGLAALAVVGPPVAGALGGAAFDKVTDGIPGTAPAGAGAGGFVVQQDGRTRCAAVDDAAVTAAVGRPVTSTGLLAKDVCVFDGPAGSSLSDVVVEAGAKAHLPSPNTPGQVSTGYVMACTNIGTHFPAGVPAPGQTAPAGTGPGVTVCVSERRLGITPEQARAAEAAIAAQVRAWAAAHPGAAAALG